MGIDDRRGGGAVGRHVRTLMHLGAVGNWTDGQLLERFVGGGEAGDCAFGAIVERHGPMVLRVCRSILGEGPDAHDAFQATFLVLVRRARSLWVRDSLAPWLHQVAWRVAKCARKDAARRRGHEQRAAELSAMSRAEGVTMRVPDPDLEAALHEELARLPARFRAPLVLCDLEGQPHELAARHLGCAVGTIKSRLHRGREKLRVRLVRRGLAPSAGVGAVSLTGQTAKAVVPAALLRSTIELAATRAVGGVVPAAVAALAEGGMRMMLIAKVRLLAIPGLLAAATVGGGLGLGVLASGEGDQLGAEDNPHLLAAAQEPRAEPKPASEPKAATPAPAPAPAQAPTGVVSVHEVTSGPLRLDITGWGSLEAINSVDVLNDVEGQVTVLMLLPDGTQVKRGDLVCELDSAALRDELVNQEITTAQREADLEQARKTLEFTEIEVREYLEGLYPLEVKTAEGQIAVATSELDLARRALEALDDPEADTLDVFRAKLAIRKAELTLQEARTKLRVLQEFTKLKRVRELEADVEQARSDMLAKQAAHALERSREQKLRDQITKCKLYAPADGVVLHASEPAPRDQNRWRVEEGSTVRERQKLLTVASFDAMRVNAKVPEAWVDQVPVGGPARIRIVAFPNNLALTGVVRSVAPQPDPATYFSANRKVYTTLIEIDDPPAILRPGMTARVEIFVREREDVLRVPVQAFLPDDDNDRSTWQVAVKTPEGAIEWRVVTVGMSNDREVEVKDGLEAGEQVVLNPVSLLSDEERRARKLDEQTPPAGPQVEAEAQAP